MRLCNNRLAVSLIFVLACSLPAWRSAAAQTAAQTPAQIPAQQASQAPATQAQPRETQPPLNVDRDPVPSPDVQPPPGAAKKTGTTLERGAHGAFTFQQNVDEVILSATVLDSKGRLVNGLTENDFKVFEDDVPQKIVAFQHSDVPVSMGILVDNSGSMRDKRAAVNTAALDLIKASNPQDEAFVVNFSDEAFIDQDFTSNIDKLRAGLAHMDSKGGTALYDAVVASADELSKHAKRPKQVLLIITDGEDNASSMTLEQTIRRVQALQGPVVYSIGLLFGNDGGGESHRARRALQLLSDQTGGIAFFPKSLSDVDQIADQVAQDIRNQYTLGYHSTKPYSEGGFRTVRVEARAPKGGKLTVRTRTGYYPKPPSQKNAPTAAAPPPTSK